MFNNREKRARAVVNNIQPILDCGNFPVKRILGDQLRVEADVFADGHESVRARLLYKKREHNEWSHSLMVFLDNDRYYGSLLLKDLGIYQYTVEAWVDHFDTWRKGLQKKAEAGTVEETDFLIGAELAEKCAERASNKEDTERLKKAASILSGKELKKISRGRLRFALSTDFQDLMETYPDTHFAERAEPPLEVWVDRERAVYSSWYEAFPRSVAGKKSKHGTFDDCINFLPYVSELGFNVLYFPPIHPIGESFRKGKNNSLKATADDPGSPWAIGSSLGGHKSIHPDLGNVDSFKQLMKEAAEYGIEIALDIAFQCSPDHPYVKEHPEWFVKRPDGRIQYAENPPKKYEDIYPINFETKAATELWEELCSVFEYWRDVGVTIFRVDNPHTKSFYFWEWLIRKLKEKYPELIFLSEAFTRPKRMYRLAKLGFTQSYTYFTWRNSRDDVAEYFTELHTTSLREYFRPNLWPNTPDILHEYIQKGGRAASAIRVILAATLSSNYGIYGPVFELVRNTPREEGSEEYLNSEKYEIKDWDLNELQSLKGLLSRLNRIRSDNKALQRNDNFRVHACDNPNILCYSKTSNDRSNTILVCVSLDYASVQDGWVEFSPDKVGASSSFPFTVRDLLNDAQFSWNQYWNYIRLDPQVYPAHILVLE